MFSVVVPVYNHSAFLQEGVVSALRSHLVNEVLLVDDGSSDDSSKEIWRLCESNPGRVINLTPSRSENIGAPERLNQLVSEASSEWIAVLNSDDTFVPGRFEILHSLLRRSKAEFAWGHLLIMDEAGTVIGTKRGALEPEYPFPASFDVHDKLASNELVDLLANQNLIATTSNMVFTKHLHDKIGGFSDYRYVHDWDFALRAAVQGETLSTPQFLTCYRVHASNTISESTTDTAREVQRLFSAFCKEFPTVAARPTFQRALEANQYVNPPTRRDRPK